MAEAHTDLYDHEDLGDWQEFLDETSGRNYYANMLTRETTWETPEEIRVQRERREEQRKSSPKKTHEAAVPAFQEDEDDVWEMYFDEETGRNYWYNTETMETTWENPEERESPKDGNPTTGADEFITPDLPSETSPPRFSNINIVPSGTNTSVAGETDVDEDVEVQDIGGKWRKVFDENSGSHYYYHVDTNVTTWTMPPEWDNRLLLNHQDALAKARASSINITPSGDDFSLPELLTPHQSSGFTRYSAADDSSEEEESDFSDEPEGPTSTTGMAPVSVVRGARKGAPPPRPTGIQPGYNSPGSGRNGGDSQDSMYGRGGSEWDKVAGRKKGAKSNVVLQDFGDSDEEDYGDAPQINVGLEKSTEWQDFAKANFRDFPMSQFATQFFRPESKGMFGARTHAQDLVHTKVKLSKSLMDISNSLNTEAVEIFRNVLGYMGDRKTKKDPEAYVKKLLSIALQATQQIQDEVFCQLIKQTTDNPDPVNNLRGCKFLAVVCGILVPSQTLVKFLSSYLYERSTSHGDVAEWARYALTRLDASMRCGRRKFFPTSEEIKAIEEMRAVNVKVHYLDGTFKTILVDSQTRVDETLIALSETLGVNHPEFYGLYEMEKTTQGDIQKYFSKLCGKNMKRQEKVNALIKCPIDRHLEKDERIMDVLASWMYGQFNLREYELVFKVRLMSKDKVGSLSKEGLNIHFIQAAYNVSYGLYPVSNQTAWELAAIQCQGVYGPHDKPFWTNGLILAKLHHYLPYSMLAVDTGCVPEKAAAEVKILTMHMDFEQYEKQDAHRMYIEKLNEIDQLEEMYGAHFFPCVRLSRLKASDGTDLNDLMLVGISEAGLALTDPFTREITTFYPLKEILTYGFRADAFLFVAGSIRKQKKWRLATYCGKAMNDLLMSYIQLKVSQAELQQSLQGMTIDS